MRLLRMLLGTLAVLGWVYMILALLDVLMTVES